MPYFLVKMLNDGMNLCYKIVLYKSDLILTNIYKVLDKEIIW